MSWNIRFLSHIASILEPIRKEVDFLEPSRRGDVGSIEKSELSDGRFFRIFDFPPHLILVPARIASIYGSIRTGVDVLGRFRRGSIENWLWVMSSRIRFLARICVEYVPIVMGVGDLEASRLEKDGSNENK